MELKIFLPFDSFSHYNFLWFQRMRPKIIAPSCPLHSTMNSHCDLTSTIMDLKLIREVT